MIEDLPFTSMIISNGSQIVHCDHGNAKSIRLKKQQKHLVYMKLHGLHHGNLCYKYKEYGVPTKILISQQQLILEH